MIQRCARVSLSPFILRGRTRLPEGLGAYTLKPRPL
jgi:hypothetical protein